MDGWMDRLGSDAHPRHDDICDAWAEIDPHAGVELGPIHAGGI